MRIQYAHCERWIDSYAVQHNLCYCLNLLPSAPLSAPNSAHRQAVLCPYLQTGHTPSHRATERVSLIHAPGRIAFTLTCTFRQALLCCSLAPLSQAWPPHPPIPAAQLSWFTQPSSPPSPPSGPASLRILTTAQLPSLPSLQHSGPPDPGHTHRVQMQVDISHRPPIPILLMQKHPVACQQVQVCRAPHTAASRTAMQVDVENSLG